MKIKSRHQLRKSQYKEMIKKITDIFEDAESVLGEKRLELVNTEEYELLLVDGKPLFLIMDGHPFFTVRGALELQPEKRIVTVDAGAVPFVVKGADIMKPGIVSADPDINENDMVIIVEENHKKALAIGKAMVPGDEMMGESGKAVKTLYRVGDKLWNFQV